MNPALDRMREQNVIFFFDPFQKILCRIITINNIGASSPFKCFDPQQELHGIFIVPNGIYKSRQLNMFVFEQVLKSLTVVPHCIQRRNKLPVIVIHQPVKALSISKNITRKVIYGLQRVLFHSIKLNKKATSIEAALTF